MKFRTAIFLTAFIGLVISGCDDGYIERDYSETVPGKEIVANDTYDFLQHYDNRVPAQQIAEILEQPDIELYSWFNIDNVLVDKTGNPFIFYSTSEPVNPFSDSSPYRFREWYYIPGVTASPVSFTIFSPLGITDDDRKQNLYYTFRVIDNDDNILFYQFRMPRKHIKSGEPWGELQMVKWDGKSFSPVEKLILPKGDGRIFNLFPKDGYGAFHIETIIPVKGLNEFMIIGEGNETYLNFKLVEFSQAYSKTVFAVWKDNKWNNWQRLSNKGKFGVRHTFWGARTSVAVDKKGNIFAVWGEYSDSRTATKYPFRISFDRFDGQEWAGNREISGQIPFSCQDPSIVLDSANNCHITWDGKDKELGYNFHHYYRQLSSDLKWGPIEKIPLKYDCRISLACDKLNRPFIYWYEGDKICCKIRIGDKLWSQTYYCLYDSQLEKVGQVRMVFNNTNDIYLVWIGRDRKNIVKRVYYKKLPYKK